VEQFQLKRGTNVSHWLSQSGRRGREREEFFTRDDVQRMVELGADHLRLPVDEEQLWDADGRQVVPTWDLMNHFLDWCRDARLRAVVDLHILRSHHFNDPVKPLFADRDAPRGFARLWRELSRELRGRPVGEVAYELMNEPVAADPADWNRVYRYAYDAIREHEPERIVVLGSNAWSQASTFDRLDVPSDDPRMVLTFHFYNPMLITHYRASWVTECKDYDGRIQYPGIPIAPDDFKALSPEVQALVGKWNHPYDAAAMKRELAAPLAVRDGTGLALWCGEFGVIHLAPDSIRAAWYRDFVGVLAELGIGWANWDYRGGFGVFDADRKPTVVARSLFGAAAA
jgi:endoglucanase